MMVDRQTSPQDIASMLQIIADEMATSSEVGLCQPGRLGEYAQVLQSISAQMLMTRPLHGHPH